MFDRAEPHEYVAYFGARIALALFGALPLQTASNLGGWIGRTFGPKLGVRKHAAARQVSVVLDLGESAASLSVADDGRGFCPAEPSEGYGLRGMRERLELVGGSVAVESSLGSGTRLTVLVPRELA